VGRIGSAAGFYTPYHRPRINEERMAANAVEAAEQSGRLSVPEIRAGVTLDKLLSSWPSERRLLFVTKAGTQRP